MAATDLSLLPCGPTPGVTEALSALGPTGLVSYVDVCQLWPALVKPADLRLMSDTPAHCAPTEFATAVENGGIRMLRNAVAYGIAVLHTALKADFPLACWVGFARGDPEKSMQADRWTPCVWGVFRQDHTHVSPDGVSNEYREGSVFWAMGWAFWVEDPERPRTYCGHEVQYDTLRAAAVETKTYCPHNQLSYRYKGCKQYEIKPLNIAERAELWAAEPVKNVYDYANFAADRVAAGQAIYAQVRRDAAAQVLDETARMVARAAEVD